MGTTDELKAEAFELAVEARLAEGMAVLRKERDVARAEAANSALRIVELVKRLEEARNGPPKFVPEWPVKQ